MVSEVNIHCNNRLEEVTMSELIVLSEINILDYLIKQGIHPHSFMTDLNEFTDKKIYFNNATVVCILVGACGFSQRRVLEEIKSIQNLIEEDSVQGVSRIEVLTDMQIPQLNNYYIYQDNIMNLVSYNKRPFKGEFWSTLPKNETGRVNQHLVARDTEDTDALCNKFMEAREANTEEKTIKDLIQVPALVEIPNLL